MPKKVEQPAPTPQIARAKVSRSVPPASLTEAVARFGTRAKAKLSNSAVVGQPEDQLRTPVELLLRDVGGLCAPLWRDQISVVGEASLRDLKCRPDLAVTRSALLVGYVELKAPGKGADPRHFRGHDRDQWERFKSLPNLVYTDGNEFSLWREGEQVGALVKLVGDVSEAGGTLAATPDLQLLLESFFRWTPNAARSAKDLADVSARLCRLLRDEVAEQLSLHSPGLEMLETTWRKTLFPEASDEQFADGYAQAVTFGMLMARAQGIELRDLNRAAQDLPNTLIGAALRVLTFADRKSKPITSLDLLRRVLDAVDWPKISKGDPDAWLYFYEDFLAVYDADLRKQTGSYYTPAEVVSEMVRLVDDVLRTRFGLTSGLAAESVTIADPAVGTGTFLLGVLRRIAATVSADQGEGAVPSAIDDAVRRLIAFDIQLGPFAVAQLRVLAELRTLIKDVPSSAPRMYVADTLSNPFHQQEWLGPVLEEMAESRRKADAIKKDERIMVVLGNPPYGDKAMGSGGWIVNGDAGGEPPLKAWVPPDEWKLGPQKRHLHNLYVYFWRWATWKAFDQYPDTKAGIVCFVSSAAFLNGTAFEKMRDYLRRTTDEVWVIDCSPEGHQPDMSTRFFEGVQRPVCIVLACRSTKTDVAKPAVVRFMSLPKGHRKEKFAALRAASIDGGWSECPTEWRAPFRPSSQSAWDSYPSLHDLLPYDGNGSMIGRTWIVAPDADSLRRRWKILRDAPSAKKDELFQPHTRNGKPGDRHPAKVLKEGLPGFEFRESAVASDTRESVGSTRYAFRSFDRQYIIPDNRLINVPNHALWATLSPRQVYLTAPMDRTPTGGPAVTVTARVPDAHHYNGRGGRVFPLWRDHAAKDPNLYPTVTATLTTTYGRDVTAEDVFAYIVAVTSHPAFTARFADDMAKPGVRVPITTDADLFAEAAEVGRTVVWLHCFGERFSDAANGRPPSAPRLAPKNAPKIPAGGTIGQSGELPAEMRYDAVSHRLHVGDGRIDGVPPAVWAYEVSGMNVLQQWFSYRNATRERPQHERRDSPLSKVVPGRWPHEYTSDLLDIINVLGRLVELEPLQASLLERICAGSTIPGAELRGPDDAVGVRPSAKTKRRAPAQATLPNVPNDFRLTPSRPKRSRG